MIQEHDNLQDIINAITNENEHRVTIRCELTKCITIFPVPNKKAITIARVVMEYFVLAYGPMKEIRTDQRPEYKNEVLTELSKPLGIEHKTTTAYQSEHWEL